MGVCFRKRLPTWRLRTVGCHPCLQLLNPRGPRDPHEAMRPVPWGSLSGKRENASPVEVELPAEMNLLTESADKRHSEKPELR